MGLFLLLTAGSAHAQLTQEQTQEVIRDAGNYLSGVALNRRGYSNGDYNIYEQRWYNHAPFWRTGQAIEALWEGYAILEHPRFKLASERAAEWMKTQVIKTQDAGGIMPAVTRKERGREFVLVTQAFRGMSGLMSAWRVAGDTAARDMALQMISFYFQKGYTDQPGIWYDYLDVYTGNPLSEDDPLFRTIEKITFDKVAHPHAEGSVFWEAYRITGNEAYKEAFLTQCEQLLSAQEEGRWSRTGEFDRSIPYEELAIDLWYAEALLNAYRITQNLRYLQAVKATVDAYLSFQEADGTFYQPNQEVIGGDNPAVDGYAVSFLGSIMVGLLEEGEMGYQPKVDICAEWLYSHRYDVYHQNINLRRGDYESARNV